MVAAFQSDAFQADAFQLDGGPPAPVAAVAIAPLSFDRGAADWVVDPATRDFIETDDGGWLESTDARSAVMFQLEMRYRAWWGDPEQGSRIRAIMSGEDPGDISDATDAALQALQPLVGDGRISDLTVAADTDETGRGVLVLSYTDRSSGRRVDQAYVPFGG